MCEVGVYWDDGYVSVGESPLVAGLGRVWTLEFPSEPPIGLSLGVGTAFEAVQPFGTGLMAYPYAFDLVGWQAWDVDIEGNIGRKSFLESGCNDMANVVGCLREVSIGAMVEQRESYGVEAEGGCFDNGTHSAAVEYVNRGV